MSLCIKGEEETRGRQKICLQQELQLTSSRKEFQSSRLDFLYFYLDFDFNFFLRGIKFICRM